MSEFRDLGLNENLSEKLEKQGITIPSPVQSLTIPRIMENKDLMAEAQTGTGKTLAFLLPMFQQFDPNCEHVQGLIITPTRELAIQITDEAKKLAYGTDFNILAVFGGQDINSQLRKLGNNVSIVIATPGRLLDHLRRNTIDLKHLKTLVLDEADQMLHIGFKNEIEMIMAHTSKTKQMLCFSATLDSKVKKLAYKYMYEPLELAVKKETITLDKIQQKVITSSDRDKQAALFNELDKANPFLSIIFCRTKRRADVLEEAMRDHGYLCNKLHGSMPQGARQKVMKAFRAAKFQYLIATDVASRGLDISGITHIYNYDVPETPEIYIHRIGRTGRMGEDGIATTFVAPKDKITLTEIETLIKMVIPKEHHGESEESKSRRRPPKKNSSSSSSRSTSSRSSSKSSSRSSSRSNSKDGSRGNSKDGSRGNSKNSSKSKRKPRI